MTERRARPVMTAFMGLDQPYQRLFGLSFRIRPFFKVILAVCVGIVSLVLLLVLLSALSRITGFNEKGKGI